MADKSVLDLIFDGMKAGWAGGAPSLPGPKVGRGLLSWGTERNRDLQELKTLYQRVRALHQQSPLANEGHLIDATGDVLARVFDYLELDPPRTLLRAIGESVRGCLDDECYSFPEIDDARWPTLSLEDRVNLRRYLSRRERMLADFKRQHDVATNAVGKVHASVLRLIGSMSASGSAGLRFDSALGHSLPDLAAAVEGAIQTFFESEVTDADLFHDLRAQIIANVKQVSGIQPWETESSKQAVLPTALRGVAPAQLPHLYLRHTPLAELFDAPVPLGIPDAVRFEHTHIVGGSGHGKTQLLQEMINQDLSRGENAPSIVVIDSQGDLIRTISRLAIFDPDAIDGLADRLVIVDPNDIDFPIALNLFAVDERRLANYGPADRERVLNGVIDLYEFFFSSLLGAELTQKQGVLFRYLARLMLNIPGATIQTLRELMESPARYQANIDTLDPSSRRFFETEFSSASFAPTRKQILRRLWGVLANPVFERMFSHPENRLDLFDAMNTGKVVLINTAKDLLKPEGASMLGRFFIARIAQAALERATIPEQERRPTFIYIDEAQDYFDDTIEHLLNQARKYRVGMILAHQNLDQLSPKLRASVMASTSVRFAGGASSKDARMLADDMRTEPEFVEGMRKRSGHAEFACYVRNHTRRAMAISVLLGRVNALPSLGANDQQRLLESNRERYCVSREEIEQQLRESVPPEPAPRAVSPERLPTPTAPEKSLAVPLPSTASPTDRDPYLAGQGGREHKYLQQFVRQAAQERGWKADVEFQIPDGSVDVALQRSGLRIACEVAVTTPPEHEQHNITKCLAAGFEEVWLIAPNAKRKSQLGRAIQANTSNYRVLLPDELLAELDARAMNAPAEVEGNVRGYKVKVRRAISSPEAAKARGDTINKIIARSLLTKKDE